MLLANMAVARKIYKHFPDIAVLRRHPKPQARMLNDLVSLNSPGACPDVLPTNSYCCKTVASFGDTHTHTHITYIHTHTHTQTHSIIPAFWIPLGVQHIMLSFESSQ